MSEIKVSQMPEANNINDNDLLMIIQGGYNKKIPKELLEIPTKAHQVNVSTEVDTSYKVNLLKTKNLFNKNSGIINNYYYGSTGTLTVDANYSSQTTFIKVKPNTTYTLSSQNADLMIMCEYDINKNFIERKYTSVATNITYTTNSTTEYIRVSFRNENINSYQIEEGSTATEYAPFINNQINVDNEKYSDTINVGAVEDSTSRVNILKSNNLLNCNSFSSYSATNVSVTPSYTDGKLDYINATKSASTTNNIFVVLAQFIFNEPTGTYKLSGCPTGGGNNTYSLYLVDNTTSQDVYPRNEGTPASVTLTKGHQYTLYLRMSNTATFSDKKFYPMLIKETEIDDTYEPYIVPSIKVDNEEIYRKPKVLWENSSPNSAFAGQTITLNDEIENYKYYEVIYRIYYNSTGIANTGRLPIDKTTLFCNDQYNRGRNISQIGGTSLKFGDAYYYATYGNSTATTNNNYIIPVQILGY